ncbi:MAG: YidC/Oxa1 family membrane protein insertase [Patescibacteria group bacterium]
MGYLYNEILHRPLLNGLVFLYNTVAFHDLGLAIVILTILIRIVLFPLFQKSAHYQTKMQRLQPELSRINKTHADNKERQLEATMALYREHGLNPFSGIFLLLVQLPILIALYQIFLNSLTAESLNGLYAFVARPETLNATLFGLINLTKSSMVMVVLAALAQFAQGRLALPARASGSGESSAERMARRMVFLAPILTIVFLGTLPSAVGLYWTVTSVFGVVQQFFINRQITHGKPGNIH